ncbi:MAG: hypothetical protein KAH86_00315 [Methanosarcinales archaeon]|nr:hypothetical protein [Methanosarcinales archaeon]
MVLTTGTEGTLINIGLACTISIISCLIAFEIRKRTIELRITSSGTTDVVPFMLSTFFVLISIESIIFAMRLAAGLTGNMQTDGTLYAVSQILIALTIIPMMFITSYVFTEDIRRSRLVAIFFLFVVVAYTYTIFVYGVNNISTSFWGTLWQHSSAISKIIYSYAIFMPAIVASSTLMIALIWIESISERYRTAMIALSFTIFYIASISEMNNQNGEYLFLIRCIFAYSILVAYLAYFPPPSIKVKCDVRDVSHGTLYQVRKREGLHYRVTTTTLLLIFITIFMVMVNGMKYMVYSLDTIISNTAIEIISIISIGVLIYSMIFTLSRFEILDFGIVNLAVGARDIENLKRSLEFTENDLAELDTEINQHLESMGDLFSEF